MLGEVKVVTKVQECSFGLSGFCWFIIRCFNSSQVLLCGYSLFLVSDTNWAQLSICGVQRAVEPKSGTGINSRHCTHSFGVYQVGGPDVLEKFC